MRQQHVETEVGAPPSFLINFDPVHPAIMPSCSTWVGGVAYPKTNQGAQRDYSPGAQIESEIMITNLDELNKRIFQLTSMVRRDQGTNEVNQAITAVVRSEMHEFDGLPDDSSCFEGVIRLAISQARMTQGSAEQLFALAAQHEALGRTHEALAKMFDSMSQAN